MSRWAANNPEQYQDVCVAGVSTKLTELVQTSGTEPLAIIETVQAIADECPKAFSELCAWAHQEISEQESAVHTRGI